MKLSRLHHLDLAGCALLSRADKLRRLRGYDQEGPRPPYKPVKNSVPDIFGAVSPLGLDIAPPTLAQIIEMITAQCRHGARQVESNVGVAKLLFPWVREGNVRAVVHQVSALGMGHIGAISYCDNLIVEYNGRRYFIMVNPRRNLGYTAVGRRFVLSAMHEQTRALDQDFAEYGLMILEFPARTRGKKPNQISYRELVMKTDAGVELLSLDQMQRDVFETYECWETVLLERAERLKKDAS